MIAQIIWSILTFMFRGIPGILGMLGTLGTLGTLGISGNAKLASPE